MARILLVDDEVLLLDVLTKALTYAGHQVITAGNGVEAEKMFMLCVPDVVITDLIMPDMEGLGLITALRRRDKTIPIIAMSGGGCAQKGLYLATSQHLGATCTLSKPFFVRQLLAAIESVMITAKRASRLQPLPIKVSL